MKKREKEEKSAGANHDALVVAVLEVMVLLPLVAELLEPSIGILAHFIVVDLLLLGFLFQVSLVLGLPNGERVVHLWRGEH